MNSYINIILASHSPLATGIKLQNATKKNSYIATGSNTMHEPRLNVRRHLNNMLRLNLRLGRHNDVQSLNDSGV